MFSNMPLFHKKQSKSLTSAASSILPIATTVDTSNGSVLSSSSSSSLLNSSLNSGFTVVTTQATPSLYSSFNNNNNTNNNHYLNYYNSQYNCNSNSKIGIPTEMSSSNKDSSSSKQITNLSNILKDNSKNNVSSNSTNNSNNTTQSSITALSPSSTDVIKDKLVFRCQLAHGSPTGLISGFSSVKELYQKIAEYFEFPTEEIIFCTLNTHKVDMTKLLGGQIGLSDFIFAHKKGQPKEVEIIKSEDALGLTITDNGAGYAFIKRIKEASVIDKIPHIMIGDHIEKLNDVNVVGKRHFEVARLLKDIPTGSTFTLRLIEPLKSGFQDIGPRSVTKGTKKQVYGSGKETLRFKANGNAEIENTFDEITQSGIDAINGLLDSFMGINDSELATQIWDLGVGKTNSMDFAEALDNSDLEAFGFTDDFIIELWGSITDARHGRLNKM